MAFIRSPYAVGLLVFNVFIAFYLARYFNRPLFQGLRNRGKQARDSPPPRPTGPPTSNLLYREYTLEELLPFNGRDREHILIGVVNNIYDVSSSPQYYGPDGSYAALAGRDASQSLARNRILKFEPGQLQTFDTFKGMSPEERSTLNDWIAFFDKKYPQVGTVVRAHTWAGSDQEDGVVGKVRGAIVENLQFPQ